MVNQHGCVPALLQWTRSNSACAILTCSMHRVEVFNISSKSLQCYRQFAVGHSLLELAPGTAGAGNICSLGAHMRICGRACLLQLAASL